MSTYEKNISAKQEKAQKDSWFQNTHENQKRTESIKKTTQEGTSRTHRLTFPKENRLLRRKEFQAVKRGRRVVGKYLCIDIHAAGAGARLGISASAKFGDATERNRFKRLIREAFRINHKELPPLDIHVIPRKHAKDASFESIAKELLDLVFYDSQS